MIADGYGRKLLDFAPERPEKRLGDVTLSKALTIAEAAPLRSNSLLPSSADTCIR